MGDSVIARHEEAFEVVRRLIIRNRLPHAILFTGKEGIGKGTFAIEVGKIILCEARSDRAHACGRCRSCRKIEASVHPDLIAVRPEGSFIKIDQIRAVIEETTFLVKEDNFRVIIIEDAERLGDEASNALLKVLEEPPQGNIFLLTSSHYYQILPTIRSRCCRIALRPAPIDELIRMIKQKSTLSEEEAYFYAFLADGSYSKIEELLEKECYHGWNEVASRVDRIAKVPMWQFFAEIGKWLEEYNDLETLLRYLKTWLIFFIHGIVLKEEQKSARYIDKCLDFFETIEEAEQALKFNVNKTLLLEEIGLMIKENLYG